jgi:hypothetical protein
MIVHLNHVIRFTFSECQWYNRLKCSVTKIVSVFCVCLLFEFIKIKMHSIIIHEQKLLKQLLFLLFSLTLFRYCLLFITIFCRFTTFNRFPAILYYFPIFLSLYTFNRFSTIFLPIFHIVLLLNLQRTYLFVSML